MVLLNIHVDFVIMSKIMLDKYIHFDNYPQLTLFSRHPDSFYVPNVFMTILSADMRNNNIVLSSVKE